VTEDNRMRVPQPAFPRQKAVAPMSEYKLVARV
jgi:hypothetical protein